MIFVFLFFKYKKLTQLSSIEEYDNELEENKINSQEEELNKNNNSINSNISKNEMRNGSESEEEFNKYSEERWKN